jgi:hypothetical protein
MRTRARALADASHFPPKAIVTPAFDLVFTASPIDLGDRAVLEYA